MKNLNEVTRRRFLRQVGLAAASTSMPIAASIGQEPPKHPADVERFLNGIYADQNQRLGDYVIADDFPQVDVTNIRRVFHNGEPRV